jgi:hypothetical protein
MGLSYKVPAAQRGEFCIALLLPGRIDGICRHHDSLLTLSGEPVTPASLRRCRRTSGDSLTAISGEMPRFSFTNPDKVVRVTPRAAAAFVVLKPRGSMHWRNAKPPGWGGLFIGKALRFFLRFVIIIAGAQDCQPASDNTLQAR